MTTKTKERAILFSAAMVRALLSGAKTQTRRVVKPQPESIYEYKSNPEMIEFLHPVTSGTYSRDSFAKLCCKFGSVGDRLWVRETWCMYPLAGNDGAAGLIYRATNQSAAGLPKRVWKSPLFMPRSASRITLEITSVRVERLQDISEEDAIAEGVLTPAAFLDVWRTIHGPESWSSNPWVWVIGFKRG